MEVPAQALPAVSGAVGGAILTLFLGFYCGGWHTTNSADRMARELAHTKVVAALAPFCVDQFGRSADAAQTAALLQLKTDYERGYFLERGGWTSLPGSKDSWGVGRACGDLLIAVARK